MEIDSQFNFNVYISLLIKKVNRSIGVLKRCAGYLPLSARKLLYNSIILPHIDYCSTVWSGASQTDIMRIQRLQSRSMRIILRAAPRTHIEDMLNTLNWMSIKQRIFYNTMVLMWRITHDCAPSYLTDKLIYAHDVHTYNTSSARNSFIHSARGHRHSLFVRGSEGWNTLPYYIRNANNMTSFKSQLRKFVFKDIEKF